MRVVQWLNDSDTITVIPVDTQPTQVVGPASAAEREQVIRQIRGLGAGARPVPSEPPPTAEIPPPEPKAADRASEPAAEPLSRRLLEQKRRRIDRP